MKASEFIAALIASGLSAEHAIIALEVAEDFAAEKCAEILRGNLAPIPHNSAETAETTEERRRRKDRERKRNKARSSDNRHTETNAEIPRKAAEISPLMAAALSKAAPPRDITQPPLENLVLTGREAAPIAVSALPPAAAASPTDPATAGPEKPSRRKPELPLAADAEISPAMTTAAEKLKLTVAERDREFERFKNHALQNDRRCRDWTAAFRNWLVGYVDRRDRAAARGMIPEDYQPTAEDLAYAEAQGWDRQKFRKHWPTFRDEIRARASPPADIGAAWRTYVTRENRASERQRARDRPRNGSIVEVVGELIAEENRKNGSTDENNRAVDDIDFSAGAIDLDPSEYRFDK